MGQEFSVKVHLLNITPYVTAAASAAKPYEDYWDSPVYDMTTDDDGNLNNPGDIFYITFLQELDKKITIISL